MAGPTQTTWAYSTQWYWPGGRRRHCPSLFSSSRLDPCPFKVPAQNVYSIETPWALVTLYPSSFRNSAGFPSLSLTRQRLGSTSSRWHSLPSKTRGECCFTNARTASDGSRSSMSRQSAGSLSLGGWRSSRVRAAFATSSGMVAWSVAVRSAVESARAVIMEGPLGNGPKCWGPLDSDCRPALAKAQARRLLELADVMLRP